MIQYMIYLHAESAYFFGPIFFCICSLLDCVGIYIHQKYCTLELCIFNTKRSTSKKVAGAMDYSNTHLNSNQFCVRFLLNMATAMTLSA